MARKKNPATARPAAARSAAHAAPAPAPVPGTGPAPDSPAGAACAALAAHPGGATTVVIADAIGIGRAAARDALTELETAGTVTRTKGGKPGIPDTWTLTAAEGTSHQPGAGHGPDGEPAASSQPADGPAAADQDGRSEDDVAADASQPEASDEASPGAGSSAAVPDGSPGEPDTVPGPEQGGGESAGDAGPGPGDSPAAAEGGAAGEPPDPALVAEITGRIEQIQAAASAAAIVLPGNLRAALAGLEEIYDQAAQGRRALRAAVGGRKAPAARPGGLREKVLGHLRDHPGKEFTPHEIHKVLGNSSGAIANALDTLVKHGDAELATEKPRKFRLAGTATAPAGTDGGAGRDGELAGAA
jgi:hypothetical protein